MESEIYGLGKAVLRETKQVAEMYKLSDVFAYVNANAQKQVTVNILEVSEIGGS